GNAKVQGTPGASATTIVVDDSNIFVPNSILLVQDTGEQMFLTAISGNTLTVTRGFAGTGSLAASFTNNDPIQLISSAYGEGTTGAEPVTQLGESRTNYVQIFKSSWSITNTAKAIEFQTGAKAAYNKSMATMYLTESIERAFMFQRPSV